MTTRTMKRVETIDQTMSTNVFSKTHLFLVNFIFVNRYMFHHVSSKQLIFIQTWGTRKSNGLFVSGFPLLVFFFSCIPWYTSFLDKARWNPYASHILCSSLCRLRLLCGLRLPHSSYPLRNKIHKLYLHISSYITYNHTHIYITIYIYTTKSSNRPNRHRIWCLCCSCCCSMCCRCRSSSICCCICCFAISGSGLCICNWMVATFPEAVRDGGDLTKTLQLCF